MKKLYPDIKNIIYQYAIIFAGFLISVSINYFLVDYINYNENLNEDEYYIWPFLYVYLTASFLHLTSPIIGFYKKRYYKSIFITTVIISTMWVIFFIAGGFYTFLLHIFLSCSVIPISYLIAWRVNIEHWNLREFRVAEQII